MRSCLITTKQLTEKRFERKRIVMEEAQLRDVFPANTEFFKINHHKRKPAYRNLETDEL